MDNENVGWKKIIEIKRQSKNLMLVENYRTFLEGFILNWTGWESIWYGFV